MLSDVAGLALLICVAFGFSFSVSESESDESDEDEDDEDEYNLAETFIHWNSIPFEGLALHLPNILCSSV